ncbi:Hydroxymethylglutaryl-CoA synthase [Phytophthora palmivora]|uniref:Hydroxymethylglutaryl-CoA synthase n=1 Tax=Phytophthora palmivora TaxID=4796 RepID=A0A2P4XJB3_9STRA|nr:Hydroxymethylglutaryl-CoA synthase [Phytophthora palmivora]
MPHKKILEEYTARMKLRQSAYGAKNGLKLTQSIASIPEGDFYLDRIDELDQYHSGAVYVAGTSIGLPGQVKVFDGENSVEKLLLGENCIQELTDTEKDNMIAQNICIQVSAVVNHDLEKDYAATIANSMDEPTQLAVAAGLETVRNAGLVDGPNAN